MVNFVRSPASSASCTWHLLLVSIGAILIVVTTIDIYLRVLSPPGESNSIAMAKTMPKLFPSGPHSIPHHGEPDDHSQSDNTVGSVFRVIEILEDLGPAGDKAWDTLLFPEKGGYVYVKTNDSSADPEPWGVAMFHGLHCLMMLRATMQEGQGTMQEMQDHGRHDHLTRDLDVLSPTHLKHCLSYIAQSLICAADGTLEPPHIAYDDNGHVIKYTVDGMVLQSEKEPLDRWEHKRGDTIDSLWG
ncbi:hypothetical protein T310_6922 [Rasamsonia emersonii CBS 393.64]|uniref:Oxidase ustYa n=1 Tax=Rasamsonia emersonii (strain ATCC 16479 / CBS 393.64 / IMI 116815) TaxID=1408163 RepID=A0A0F4YMT0_RASE3|nr:hypothetical protein T310_6922 [Rasamsonia emersonii CBS 393.64]KKA19131.1 hypothetical protein T310_6922 [Rasamsonia emersonii CBS 393.64]